MAVAGGVDLDVDVDDDCGCAVTTMRVDGRDVQVHHFLPDDFAPHAPTSECGCGPQLRQVSDVLWVYEHVDQDGDDDFPDFRDRATRRTAP